MKYILTLTLLSISLLCTAQSEADQTFTLNPENSRIIGGFFSLDGRSQWNENGSTQNNYLIQLGPYISLQRSAKKDLLLRTDLRFQSSGDGGQGNNSTTISTGIGVDWRHELYQFNRFKVFGSYGPRVELSATSQRNTTELGYYLAGVGNISLAYEFTPNIRLLTSIVNGTISYQRTRSDLNSFNFRIRNSLLSPNFSIEYILPRKS